MEFRFDAINAFNTPIFAVGGYSTDVFPGGGIDKTEVQRGPELHRGNPDRRSEYVSRVEEPSVCVEAVLLM